MLLDRLAERAALGRLVEAARAGRSGVLVVRGEPGVGKTALVEDAVASAAGVSIVRAAGVESEMELAGPGPAGPGPARHSAAGWPAGLNPVSTGRRAGWGDWTGSGLPDRRRP
jgi:hypothetical protein